MDPAVQRVRIAKPAEREPRFLTWEEAQELHSWMPEHVARIVPLAILTMLRGGEIPEPTFHDLRHTGASLMIAAGCHVMVIAEQMGHSDGGGLVLKRYGPPPQGGPPSGCRGP